MVHYIAGFGDACLYTHRLTSCAEKDKWGIPSSTRVEWGGMRNNVREYSNGRWRADHGVRRRCDAIRPRSARLAGDPLNGHGADGRDPRLLYERLQESH